MERLSEMIVKYKRLIIILFIIMAVIFAVLSKSVKVNYNLSEYLPEDTLSTVALEEMNSEYNTKIPNARVLIKNISIAEALEYKEKLFDIDGVDEVNWLDDSVNINEPLESMDKKTVETWYKDNSAVFTLVINEDKEIEAIQNIRKLIGDDNSMSGDAVDTVSSQLSTQEEIKNIILLIIPIVFIILIIATDSYFEPVLFLLTIGVAILINQGTNIFFKEISFVTNAAQSILQLAVSMDYAIFLLHSFAKERETETKVEKAMQKAISQSVSSIASSAITTIIGFAALMFMKFKIGVDMGVVMAKAIVISLITIITLLPALTMYCYKLIDKTKHKILFNNFEPLSRLIQKIKIPIIILFVIIIIPCNLASERVNFTYGSAGMFGDETSQVGREAKEIEELFGKSNQLVLMVEKGDLAKEKSLAEELKNLKNVTSVISYTNMVGNEIPIEYVPKDSLSMLISEKYSRMVISINCDVQGDETFDTVENIRKIADKYYDKSHLAGESVSTYDLKTTVLEDNVIVNSISMIAIFVVLLINFKSLLVALILVFIIKVAIWMNLAVPYFLNSELNYISYLIISAIQLGATVDYAILYASKYLEHRKTKNKQESTKGAITETTLSILTSASIMIIAGFVLGFMSSNGVISQIGKLIGRGTIFSIVMVLFVLPLLLMILDKIIQKTSIGLKLKNQN